MTDTSVPLAPHGTLSSPERSGEARRTGEQVGAAPLPPPAPAPGNVDPRVISDQLKAKKRELRDARLNGARAKAKNTNPRYYWYAGAVVASALAVVGCRNYMGFQRDTALALADTRGGLSVAPETTAAPAAAVGMPNPLQSLPLSSQAVYVLGAQYRTNDKGEAVGFTDLPPNRSAAVIGKLLEDVDLCNVYLSLGAKTEIVVAMEPSAGSYPLIDPGSQMCALPAYVPLPQDPMPTTTVAP